MSKMCAINQWNIQHKKQQKDQKINTYIKKMMHSKYMYNKKKIITMYQQ